MILPHTIDDLMADVASLASTSDNSTERQTTTSMTISDLVPNTMVDANYFPDDIWNNGMFSRTFFDDIVNELQLDNPYDSLFAQTIPPHWRRPSAIDNSKVLINNHDIMWGAQKRCQNSVRRSSQETASTSGLGQTSQQSLLRPHLRGAGVPVFNMITPHTPPMSDSDDEDTNTDKSKALPLPSSLTECSSYFDTDFAEPRFDEMLENRDQEGDSSMAGSSSTAGSSRGSSSTAGWSSMFVQAPVGLFGRKHQESSLESESESLESEEEEEENYESEPSMVMQNVTSVRCNLRATQNDHSYYISDRNSSMVMSDLGIDTPSDSEEEIDVVSVSDKKYPVGTRMGYIPPTNPPNGRRRITQKPIEPAASNMGNNRNGVKVMFPAKRNQPPVSNYPQAKRRATAPVTVPVRTTNKGRKPRQTRAKGRRRSNYCNDSGSENDYPPREKRSLHNDMERRRRVDLKKSFDNLRRSVPAIEDNEKAAKVTILTEAALYCAQLIQDSKELEEQEKKIINEQRILQWRVSALRKECAKMAGVLDDNFVLHIQDN